MFEARVILPNQDNHGNDISHVHNRLGFMLADKFGGFTRQATCGGYVNGDGELQVEHGLAYDVAMPADKPNLDYIRAVAEWAANAADQECVYLRTPTGHVEFVQPSIPVAVAA